MTTTTTMSALWTRLVFRLILQLLAGPVDLDEAIVENGLSAANGRRRLKGVAELNQRRRGVVFVANLKEKNKEGQKS